MTKTRTTTETITTDANDMFSVSAVNADKVILRSEGDDWGWSISVADAINLAEMLSAAATALDANKEATRQR